MYRPPTARPCSTNLSPRYQAICSSSSCSIPVSDACSTYSTTCVRNVSTLPRADFMNHEPLILGICNTSDSGAALLRGNDILGAVGEERLNRVKLTREFPVRAITWLLKEAGCTAVDLDHIACGAWAGLDPTLGPPLLVESLL